jgi:hypothetical protein
MAHRAIIRETRFEPSPSVVGAVEATYSILFIDTVGTAHEAAEVVLTIDLSGTINSIQSQIASAIRSHGASLGLTVGVNDVLLNDFVKG